MSFNCNNPNCKAPISNHRYLAHDYLCEDCGDPCKIDDEGNCNRKAVG